MPIQLPALEYGFDALEPHISSTTLKTHLGKHLADSLERPFPARAGHEVEDIHPSHQWTCSFLCSMTVAG